MLVEKLQGGLKVFLVYQAVHRVGGGVDKGHIHLAAEAVQRPLEIAVHEVKFAGVVFIKGRAVDQRRPAQLIHCDLLKGGVGQTFQQSLVDLFQGFHNPQIGCLHRRSLLLFHDKQQTRTQCWISSKIQNLGDRQAPKTLLK